MLIHTMYDIRNKTTDQKNTILMDTKLLCEDIRTIRLKRNGDSALGFAIRGGKFEKKKIFI